MSGLKSVQAPARQAFASRFAELSVHQVKLFVGKHSCCTLVKVGVAIKQVSGELCCKTWRMGLVVFVGVKDVGEYFRKG